MRVSWQHVVAKLLKVSRMTKVDYQNDSKSGNEYRKYTFWASVLEYYFFLETFNFTTFKR